MSILTPDSELIRIGADYLRIVSFSYLFVGISQCFLMMMKVAEEIIMAEVIQTL